MSNRSNRPSIRLRRFPSAEGPTTTSAAINHPPSQVDSAAVSSSRSPTLGATTTTTGRRRSVSDPSRGHLPVLQTPVLHSENYRHLPPQHLSGIQEFPSSTDVRDFASPSEVAHREAVSREEGTDIAAEPSALKPLPSLPPALEPALAQKTAAALARPPGSQITQEVYDAGLVDYLDLVDPEVSTLNTLNNVQNSLFVPDLGRFLNRRPTYNLTKRPSDLVTKPRSRRGSRASRGSVSLPQDTTEFNKDQPIRPSIDRSNTLKTIDSTLSDTRYAVLPHGISLEGWSKEDKQELNDHVRHFLHSKRSRFKRSMRGFGQYLRKPLGFFVTLYAFLITVFGLIWVLFLIGWVNVGGRKYYVINVIDNVLVALFAIMGDGLAPFRAVDTYHMCFIAHYHRLTWKLRKVKALPKLDDHNDLPTQLPVPEDIEDVELGRDVSKSEFTVLTPKQQEKLVHHQQKFANSHTFYKPHETTTHHAFPLKLLIAIVVLLDCHSLLQISLGACTWGISYHTRPFALTTVILCCSITVNITAGILITIGDRRTRKKDVLEKMHRQDLTAEAIQKLEKRRRKEEDRNGHAILESGESSTGLIVSDQARSAINSS